MRTHGAGQGGDPLHAVEGMYVAFIFADWEMISKPLEFYAVCLFVWGIFGHRLVQQQHAKRLTVRLSVTTASAGRGACMVEPRYKL